MAFDELERTMLDERGNWNLSWKIYGTIYFFVRAFLIVASSIVAAEATLATSETTTMLVDWVPILAVLVTIFTALDTWLKPQQKWVGFMRDRDHLEALIIRLKDEPDVDQTARKVRAEFETLRERHRMENVF